MATHSSILAWRIPGTEEPGRRPSLGSHGVGHDWSDLAAWLVSLVQRKSQPSQLKSDEAASTDRVAAPQFPEML